MPDALKPSLDEAIQLVESVETARRTGQGDARSNHIVTRLLAIANDWIEQAQRVATLAAGE